MTSYRINSNTEPGDYVDFQLIGNQHVVITIVESDETLIEIKASISVSANEFMDIAKKIGLAKSFKELGFDGP